MANATSPLNTNTKDLDPLVAATGTSSLKRAVGPIAAAGIGDTIANTGVATDVDDAAFTPGTSSVVVAGALADETATDSVDEGDAGALRMTLNRRPITAGQFLDDSAFGVATDYVSPIAALADEAGTDSVDEGDIGVVRMTLDRRLHIKPATVVEVTATPTLDTLAYASGDCLDTTILTFSGAVGAALSGVVDTMVIADAALQSQPCELWLFNATVTPAAENAAHSISDADAAKCIGVIYSGPYYASALNSVSVAKGIGLAIKCAASSLYGIAVTRGTPTYAADSLTFKLVIYQD